MHLLLILEEQEEIAEVMSKVSLKHLNAPCILYNLNGYYDDLKNLLNKMITYDLSSKDKQEDIYFVENLSEIVKVVEGYYESTSK